MTRRTKLWILGGVLLVSLLAGYLVWGENPIFAEGQNGTVQRTVILHFGDIGDTDPNMFFGRLAQRYNWRVARGVRPIVIGSGDYVVLCRHEDLLRFKSAVDRFMTQTGCPAARLILALGNHDDPGRVRTAVWNEVWGGTRPVEGTSKLGNTVIAWMHSEHPDLGFLSRSLQQKREACPSCLVILVGHKPLILESQYSGYQSFLLPEPWRSQTLNMLTTYSAAAYLTGHFEMHSTLTYDGVLHNRVTPARRGFEEIVIPYDPISRRGLDVTVTTLH